MKKILNYIKYGCYGVVALFLANTTHKVGLKYYTGLSTYKVLSGPMSNRFSSGFAVKDQKGRKFVVTNYHVCEAYNFEGKVSIRSSLNSNKETIQSIIIWSIVDDICVLTAPNDASGISLYSEIEFGKNINVVGHPQLRELELNSGEIVQWDRIVVMQMYLGFPIPIPYLVPQIDALAYPGNSGSAVVDDFGSLVGILFAGNGGNNKQCYIIPAKNLSDILSRIP